MTDAGALATTFFEAFREKRIHDIRGLLHGDFTFRGPLQNIDDPDAYVETLGHITAATSRLELRAMLVGADEAVLLYDMTTRAGVTVRIWNWLRMKRGKLSSSDLLYDSPAMMKAMGMMERPG